MSPNLGLVGYVAPRAGDPQLEAKLKALVADALAPLKELDARAAHGTTQPAEGGNAKIDARIAELIAQLGSEEYTEREKAQQELVKIGAHAIAALEKATSDGDPERGARARAALRQIKDNALTKRLVGAWRDRMNPGKLIFRPDGRFEMKRGQLLTSGRWWVSEGLLISTDLLGPYGTTMGGVYKVHIHKLDDKALELHTTGGPNLSIGISLYERADGHLSGGRGEPASSDEPRPRPPAEGAKGETDKRIAELIARLGGETFKDREAAQRGLVKIGTPAVPALQEAAVSGDPERAIRARQALEQIPEHAVTGVVRQFLAAMLDGDAEAMGKLITDDSPGWPKELVIKKAMGLRHHVERLERPYAPREIVFKREMAAARMGNPNADAKYLILILRKDKGQWRVYELRDSGSSGPLSGWLNQAAKHAAFREYDKASHCLI